MFLKSFKLCTDLPFFLFKFIFPLPLNLSALQLYFISPLLGFLKLKHMKFLDLFLFIHNPTFFLSVLFHYGLEFEIFLLFISFLMREDTLPFFLIIYAFSEFPIQTIFEF